MRDRSGAAAVVLVSIAGEQAYKNVLAEAKAKALTKAGTGISIRLRLRLLSPRRSAECSQPGRWLQWLAGWMDAGYL